MDKVELFLPVGRTFGRHLSYRIEQRGGETSWDGLWHNPDELQAELLDDNTIRFYRTETNADIIFRNIHLEGLTNFVWHDPVIVEKGVPEVKYVPERNGSSVDQPYVIRREFTKLRRREQAFNVGMTTAIEAGYEGFGASVNVSVELSAEYSETWGEEATDTHIFEQSVNVPAKTLIKYKLSRSHDKMKQLIECEGKLTWEVKVNVHNQGGYWIDGYEWDSWGDFLRVAKRRAPITFAGYQLFIDHPLVPGEIDQLSQPLLVPYRHEVQYDNAEAIEIDIHEETLI